MEFIYFYVERHFEKLFGVKERDMLGNDGLYQGSF